MQIIFWVLCLLALPPLGLLWNVVLNTTVTGPDAMSTPQELLDRKLFLWPFLGMYAVAICFVLAFYIHLYQKAERVERLGRKLFSMLLLLHIPMIIITFRMLEIMIFAVFYFSRK